MTVRALAVAIALAVSMPAEASTFWAHIEEPESATAPTELGELIRAGAELGVGAQLHKRQAQDAQNLLQRRQHRAEMKSFADRAIGLLERAAELDPNNATLQFALAEYYYEFLYDYYERDLPLASKLAEVGRAAIAHWAKFEQLSPKDPRRLNFVRNAYPISPISGQTGLVRYPYQFKRSIIYTKLGGTDEWEKAVEDYDYCLAVAPPEAAPADWTAQLLTNSAEIMMALGHLDEAIERYEESFQHQNDELYMYGLAVAYDRKGLSERAMDMVRDALAIERADPNKGPMAALSRQGVFFIPRGDVHYYSALAYEAQGDTTAALLHYREFLDRVEDSPYADQARRHIEQLTSKGAKAGAAKRKR